MGFINIFVGCFVFVMGLAGAPAIAQLLTSPSSVDFGSMPINGPGSSQIVTVTNESSQGISDVMVTNDCVADFSVDNECFGPLEAFGECQIYVSFRPTSLGIDSCTIEVDTISNGAATVFVQGEGQAANDVRQH